MEKDMKSQKIQLLERDISLLEKTVINDYVNLKTKLIAERGIEVVNKEYQAVEAQLKTMIPSSAHYIDNLQFWQPTFEDYDDPIDFSNN
jgi:hypothetical protein